MLCWLTTLTARRQGGVYMSKVSSKRIDACVCITQRRIRFNKKTTYLCDCIQNIYLYLVLLTLKRIQGSQFSIRRNIRKPNKREDLAR